MEQGSQVASSLLDEICGGGAQLSHREAKFPMRREYSFRWFIAMEKIAD
jgi:hypothetical protein